MDRSFRAALLARVLVDEYQITTEDQLLSALGKMKPMDIAQFTTPFHRPRDDLLSGIRTEQFNHK